MSQNLIQNSPMQVLPFNMLAPTVPVDKLAKFFDLHFPEFGMTESRLKMPFEAESPLSIFQSWIVIPENSNLLDVNQWLGFASIAQPRVAPKILETFFLSLDNSSATTALWNVMNKSIQSTPGVKELTQIAQVAVNHTWLTSIYEQNGFIEIARSVRQALDLKSFEAVKEADSSRWITLSVADYIQSDWKSENARQLGELIAQTDLDVPMPEEYRTTNPEIVLARNFTDPGPMGNAKYSYVAIDPKSSPHESNLVGFIVHGKPNNGAIMIYNLGVSTNYRKQGIASYLKKISAVHLKSEHLIKEIRTQNHKTNVAVIALNQKLGYVVVAEIATLKKET